MLSFIIIAYIQYKSSNYHSSFNYKISRQKLFCYIDYRILNFIINNLNSRRIFYMSKSSFIYLVRSFYIINYGHFVILKQLYCLKFRILNIQSFTRRDFFQYEVVKGRITTEINNILHE